jgi:subtilase family serine protease
MRTLPAFVIVIAASTLTTPLVATPASAQPTYVRSCAIPARAHVMACQALRMTKPSVSADARSAAKPSGYGPSDLRSAYNVPSGASGVTVAITEAYNDRHAAADLKVYRSEFGLPSCTTANGCLRIVNQKGAKSPLPKSNSSWAGEVSLDLDMVSAICPKCHILLVEASSANDSDLVAAVSRAVTMGAKYVSNSWGGSEFSGQTTLDKQLNHPGVAITFSTGDDGYGPLYPATSRYVTAVGGTSLRRSSASRGFTETVWSDGGSGCSKYDAKPSWQTVTTTCSRRAEADVSAVADPNTGVAVYQTYGDNGWAIYGGTSAASPIVASMYALAGTPGGSGYPASYPYANASKFHDVTSGHNGGCGSRLCTAIKGWDGPTGLGTPNGVTGLRAPAKGTVRSGYAS